MPRRRISDVSVSLDQDTKSDKSLIVTINDELPDAGLPKTKSRTDATKQKKTTINFPVDVITRSGKFSGMGTIDLDTDQADVSSNLRKLSTIERTTKSLRKTKEELKEVLTQFEQDMAQVKQKEQQVELTTINKLKPQKKTETLPDVNRAKKKDAAKEAREAKRIELKAKKQAIDKAVEEDKRAKAELDAVNKIYKPTECLKYITLEIHPDLASSSFMEDTKREAKKLGIRIEETDEICEPGVLLWSRSVPTTLASEAGQLCLAPSKHQSPHSLYLMSGKELVSVHTTRRVTDYLAEMRDLLGSLRTLLVFNSNVPGKTKAEFMSMISEVQIDSLLTLKLDVVVAHTPAELSDIILHYTKAVAEAPFKKAKRDIDEQAKFYMRGDNKNCVTVDKDGNGLSRLWEQMLAVLPHSSLEVARTLGAEFTTPSSLLQEFQSPGSLVRVADIGVSRTNVPGAKARRIGPEFARKLHTLLTAGDPGVVIE